MYKSLDELKTMSPAQVAEYVDELEKTDETAKNNGPEYQEWYANELDGYLEDKGVTIDEFADILNVCRKWDKAARWFYGVKRLVEVEKSGYPRWIDEEKDLQSAQCRECGKVEELDHHSLVISYICRKCAGADYPGSEDRSYCPVAGSWEECNITCNQCE